jgi:hypothetical protein
VEANEELGLPVDSREYGIGAQVKTELSVMLSWNLSPKHFLFSEVCSYRKVVSYTFLELQLEFT